MFKVMWPHSFRNYVFKRFCRSARLVLAVYGFFGVVLFRSASFRPSRSMNWSHGAAISFHPSQTVGSWVFRCVLLLSFHRQLCSANFVIFVRTAAVMPAGDTTSLSSLVCLAVPCWLISVTDQVFVIWVLSTMDCWYLQLEDGTWWCHCY